MPRRSMVASTTFHTRGRVDLFEDEGLSTPQTQGPMDRSGKKSQGLRSRSHPWSVTRGITGGHDAEELPHFLVDLKQAKQIAP